MPLVEIVVLDGWLLHLRFNPTMTAPCYFDVAEAPSATPSQVRNAQPGMIQQNDGSKSPLSWCHTCLTRSEDILHPVQIIQT